MNNIKKQTLAQKQAEVKFREIISQQHSGKVYHFSEEFSEQEMLLELKKRLRKTKLDFSKLKNQRIDLPPFLEIGAEYCVRSLTLTNNFNAEGIALDIARAPLETATYFAKKFHFKKMPLRVCADAEHLPFKDDAFALVFCYQTLHHFTNPRPVIKEILRVLRPGGYFFFAEEPIRQDLNLKLFRRPTKTQGLRKFLKYTLLLPFISQIGKTEVDFGIVEDAFPISLWNKLFSSFAEVQVEVESYFGPSSTHLRKVDNGNWIKPRFIQKTLIAFLGGGISGIAKKYGSNKQIRTNNLLQLLVCPICHSRIKKVGYSFVCEKCKKAYSTKNGVLNLLDPKLTKLLYEKIRS